VVPTWPIPPPYDVELPYCRDAHVLITAFDKAGNVQQTVQDVLVVRPCNGSQ